MNKDNAKLFDAFTGIDRASLYTDLDLLRVLNGNIYFTLEVSCYIGNNKLAEAIITSLNEKGHFSSDSCFSENTKEKNGIRHYGVWSVNLSKSTAEYHLAFSDEYRSANFRV